MKELLFLSSKRAALRLSLSMSVALTMVIVVGRNASWKIFSESVLPHPKELPNNRLYRLLTQAVLLLQAIRQIWPRIWLDGGTN